MIQGCFITLNQGESYEVRWFSIATCLLLKKIIRMRISAYEIYRSFLNGVDKFNVFYILLENNLCCSLYYGANKRSKQRRRVQDVLLNDFFIPK